MLEKPWYLALCCTACPRGCSCAALSLGPRNPTRASVACTKPLVCGKWGRNMRMYGLHRAKHTHCTVETCEQVSRRTNQLETCRHTVRSIFKDPYFTPWGSDSAYATLSGRFPTPQVVSLDSMIVSLKSRCRNCLEHAMPQAPIPTSSVPFFRGLDLAMLFLTGQSHLWV